MELCFVVFLEQTRFHQPCLLHQTTRLTASNSRGLPGFDEAPIKLNDDVRELSWYVNCKSACPRYAKHSSPLTSPSRTTPLTSSLPTNLPTPPMARPAQPSQSTPDAVPSPAPWRAPPAAPDGDTSAARSLPRRSRRLKPGRFSSRCSTAVAAAAGPSRARRIGRRWVR